jgi:hypothetical protein
VQPGLGQKTLIFLWVVSTASRILIHYSAKMCVCVCVCFSRPVCRCIPYQQLARLDSMQRMRSFDLDAILNGVEIKIRSITAQYL